ncbi:MULTISPECIES: hypothetical protein [Staphylococcaceae]|uniref:Uncharacterized protein n=1 Tax=Macrococcus psychrotolerans TaxID=3039389 RepID=A0AAT9P7E4_9STAP|nr:MULTISPECIES: hypothetical protein [Staphylococcaceae]PKD97965.1 hypothetical protein CW719_09790 [Macrococcus caseolyticus]PKE47204.1 hypothetical protein CW677_09240 [Macrococcus caseolyticus]PKE66840.1 hypothetical protein CW663_11115 [Macrococcus caseolyticus]PKF13978.1 hypothetical protein CW690_09235 [Macrococcus caseolyticus]PKF18420.1 hypothetical protein CW717_09790 [Macrococcus caseolyticus]
MNLDQCLVVAVSDEELKVRVYSPLLKKEIIVSTTKEYYELINESEEQIFVTVDLSENKIVED